ncbi:hypothetical protein SEVIR_8G003050v4 [Setaria viridis]
MELDFLGVCKLFQLRYLKIMLVSWKIWKERNERVFARSPPKDVSQLLHEIIQEGQLWCASGAKHLAAIGSRSAFLISTFLCLFVLSLWWYNIS